MAIFLVVRIYKCVIIAVMARYALDDIPNSVRLIHGLPQPDWSVVQPWVEARRQSKDDLLYDSIAADWLLRLADALEPGLPVFEYPELFVLIGPEISWRDMLADQIERTYLLVNDVLKVRRPDGVLHPGKSVAICFGNDEEYSSYVAAHYPEEGRIKTAGVQVREGFCHIVVNWSSSQSMRTIAHEFVHLKLYGLGVPLWIEEGLAQYFEFIDSRPSARSFSPELRDAHRMEWSEDRIQKFWDGDAFQMAEEETMGRAYQLAFMLVRAILHRWPKRTMQWIEQVRGEDAGAAATRAVLGRDLATLVGGLLGSGDWAPRLKGAQAEADDAERR